MFSDLTAWDLAAVLSKFFAYGGSFVAAGSVLFLVVNGIRAREIERSLRLALLLSVCVAIVASMAQFLVQSGRLMDDGMTGALDPDMLQLVSDAPLGTSVFLRVAGLVLLVAFAAFRGNAAAISGGLGALVVAASFSFVGHGTGEPRWFLSSMVTLHILAVSFWIGALLPLYALAHSSRNVVAAGQIAHSFGQQAAWFVALLAIIGGVLAWWLVGSVEALFGSEYGLTLLTKLVVVVALLALAAANKLRFVPAMMEGSSDGARHLRHSIRWEAVAIATILLVTAVLTTVTSLPMAADADGGSVNMEDMDHGN